MKPWVCLSSRLNLARRKAENAVMRKAEEEMIRCSMRSVTVSVLAKSENTIPAGAKPNVMTSASESSSFPMGDETLSSRATNPSKKSKIAPIIMKIKASSKSPLSEKAVAMQPEIRLQQVSALGICFFIWRSLHYSLGWRRAIIVWLPTVVCPGWIRISALSGK